MGDNEPSAPAGPRVVTSEQHEDASGEIHTGITNIVYSGAAFGGDTGRKRSVTKQAPLLPPPVLVSYSESDGVPVRTERTEPVVLTVTRPRAAAAIAPLPKPAPAASRPMAVVSPEAVPTTVATSPSSATAKWFEQGEAAPPEPSTAVRAPAPAASPVPAPAAAPHSRTLLFASMAVALAGAAIAVAAVVWAMGVAERARADAAAHPVVPVVASATPPAAPSSAAAAAPPTSTAPAPSSAVAPVPPPPAPAPAEASTPPPLADDHDAPGAAATPTCDLEVTSNAAGATIVIDGRVRGPVGSKITTRCRTLDVVVRHANFEETSRKVKLVPGGTKLHVTLERAKVELVVMTTPPGALVTTSTNKVLGKTPLITRIERDAPMTLFFKMPGMASEWRAVRADANTTVNVPLAPLPAAP